jgi:glycosyltransferase involved in cell wall biosynthesis
VTRVLVVSYHFPPAAGVAAARVGKLVKYLARLGWEPCVVAAPHRPEAPRDDDLAADVAGIERVDVRPLGGAPGIQGADWASAALAPARRLAASAEVAFVSGGPFMPFLLGPALGIPYVLDFRDPWSYEPRFDRFDRRVRRRAGLAVERRAEAIAVRRAGAVVTVAPQLSEEYARLYPRAQSRIRTLRHGYDPEDFDGRAPAPTTPPVLLHAGTMAPGDRSPRLVLETSRLVRARGINLRVRLLGRFPEQFEPLAREARREGWLETPGYLPRRATTRAMQEATVLWLEPGNLDFLITGKVYEYLAARRPIVAAASRDGAVADLLDASGGGVVVPADPAGCAEAVEAALAGRISETRSDVLSRLSHPHLAGELAGVLGRACR